MGFDFPPGTCDSALANPILVGMARKIRVELSCWMLERHFLWDCTGCNCTQIPTAKLPKASSRTSVTTPPPHPHPQLIPPPPSLVQSHAATDQRSFGELIHDLHISAKNTLIIFKMKVGILTASAPSRTCLRHYALCYYFRVGKTPFCFKFHRSLAFSLTYLLTYLLTSTSDCLCIHSHDRIVIILLGACSSRTRVGLCSTD